MWVFLLFYGLSLEPFLVIMTFMTPRVREILSWYGSESIGVLRNLALLLNQGSLAGTGKLLILPVDQGFEHGPTRSFVPNPKSYDPHYHFRLAVKAKVSAYAAPLGFLEASGRDFAGEIPLILKLNNSDSLFKDQRGPVSAVTSSVTRALNLGCVGIGFTIYPGSSQRKKMYEEITLLAEEAKSKGLLVIIWSYPRGGELSSKGETALDVVSYAAHIAAQLGAHIIKVKPPSSHIEGQKEKKIFSQNNIPIDNLSDRIRYVLDSCFNGKRVVIFSGGEARGDKEILEEVRQLARGGAFGSIMGRNIFQREESQALKLIDQVMSIYKGC